MVRRSDLNRPASAGRKVATVFAVFAALLAVLGAGAAAFVRFGPEPEGRLCTLSARIGGDVHDTPEEAFAAWWPEMDPAQLAYGYAASPDQLPDPPTADDFERDGRNYRWYPDETHRVWLQVDIDHPMEAGASTSDGWTVVGVNRCGKATATT